MAGPNWWESDPVSPTSDPGFTGVIPGAPKPKTPKAPVFVPKDATRIFDPETNTYSPVPQDVAPLDEQKREELRNEALSKVRTAASLIKRSKEGWFTTGFGAGIASKIGGTQARDVAADTETLKAAGALARIMEMSKETGKNLLTPISNADFEAMSRSIANLDITQSDENYQKNVQTVIDIYKRAYVNAGGKASDIDDLLKTEDDRAPPPHDGQFGDEGGGGGPPGSKELNPEQTRAYKAFLSANPNPSAAQVKTFLGGIGVENVANAEDIARGIKEGRGVSTDITRPDIEAATAAKTKDLLSRSRGRVSSTAAGALDSLSLGGWDEFQGGIDAFQGALQGEGKFSDLYDINVGANRAANAIRQGDHPNYYGGGQLAAAIALPTGKISGALDAAKVGAGYGALYGFNSGTDTGSRLGGAAIGGTAGAVLGPVAQEFLGAGAAGRALAARNSPRGLNPELAAASAAEGVDLLRPMVDPSAISNYGALESNVYSQPIIRGAAGRVRGQIEDRVGRLAPGGTALEEGAAGEALQIAGNRYITRSRGLKDRLYKRAENAAGDARFVPQKALAQVDDEIAQLSGNPETNAAEIAFLQKVKEDLSAGSGKTVGEIRNIREGLRGEIGRSNLTLSGAETRSLRVMSAAADDIAEAIPAAGSAYRRADNFYRERMVMVDDIKRAILGKKDDPLDPQKAFANIKSLASPGANGRRLAAIMRHLEPDERQDIAATVAMSLGRRAPDEPFSTALFVSQTRKLSPSARRTIFGPDGAQSIDNLRLLARKLEEGEKDINFSRSASTLERAGWKSAARNVITTLAGLGGAGAMGAGYYGTGVAGLAVAGTAMGASATRKVLSARAMVNPRVSRWLAESADVSTAQQAAQSVRKLGVIISREPALAHELQPIQDMLRQRITQPLAAESGDQDDQRQ